VAAGPGFVVELANLAARIWTTGAGSPQQAQTLSLGSVFRTNNDRLTDPRILYDLPSGRWFASIADLDTSGVVLAVSRSSDPTAGWNVYSYAASGCADQPRLGVADGIVVIAADVFSSCVEEFAPLVGNEMWIVNKQQLVDGATTPASTTYGPDKSLQSLAPVQSLSSTATEYVVSVDSPSSGLVHLLTVDGIPPDAVRVQSVASLPISLLAPPPRAAQPPTGTGGRQPSIETNDNRVLDSVWENGKLWLSANGGCIPAGDTALRSCARVTEIATATMSVDWDTDLGQTGSYLFYPAIRPDSSGNLVIVYGESGPTVLPELVAIGRTPDGTFTAPAVIGQSPSPQVGGRYGDYFGAARDPLHPELVWVAGEQGADVLGGDGWSTTVAAVQVSLAGVAPPAVSSSAPPSVKALVAAGRAGVAIRLAYAALDDGTGVREHVVVSAKKAVVFTTTTAKGRVHVGQSYSVVWRPAKKLRGTYRWCVHSISAAGMQSPDSCSIVTVR
jgi:hypothetical protein